MLVEFPIFGAGIIYFPTEISALRVFEPRYLLLIGDSILNKQNFIVSSNLDNKFQIGSEVEIIEHQDISNAEQLVIVKSIKLHKINQIDLSREYPFCMADEYTEIGLPPSIDELNELEKNITKAIAKLVENGMDINLPNFIYDSENRINKLNELCIVMPMNIDLRNEIIKENDLYKKYEILNSYTNNINEN
tara:strand:+ start:153 stop:725 length:573 start_codon:yes stop_codon:yes gene_type:complete